VTHRSSLFATGMHGPNMAHGDLPGVASSLPATAFGHCGSSRGSRRTSITGEADVSKRPFAHPKRLVLPNPPLRGQCSRPASWTPCRNRPPVRSVTGSFPCPRFPAARGRSTPATRYQRLVPTSRQALPALLYLRTFRSFRFNARPGSPSG